MRAGLPNADPWLLPLAALLCALGLTEIYRLQPTLARDQSVWIVIGLIGFLGLIFVLGDHRRLEAYKYSLATVAVGLLLFTMVAGTTVNGARLWIRIGGMQVQPGEFVKLLLVISLAGYLRENREVLTYARRRVLGVDIPAARHLGPLALMAAVSLGVLAVMNDLGSALLLFGIFLAMIYVATGRHLYTVLGLGTVRGRIPARLQGGPARARALLDLDRSLVARRTPPATRWCSRSSRSPTAASSAPGSAAACR